MEDMMFLRIDGLMKSQGKRMQDLLGLLGLSRSTYDNWKTGKSKSYTQHIEKICDFLNVTPNYLIFGYDSNGSGSPENPIEEEMLTYFRTVPNHVQKKILELIKQVIQIINVTERQSS